jgi:hypothetical protein
MSRAGKERTPHDGTNYGTELSRLLPSPLSSLTVSNKGLLVLTLFRTRVAVHVSVS